MHTRKSRSRDLILPEKEVYMSDIKKIPEYFGCNVFNDAAMRE